MIHRPVSVAKGHSEFDAETIFHLYNFPFFHRLSLSLNFHLQVRTGLSQLCQRVFGSNGLIQAALPTILKDTPEEYLNETVEVIKVCFMSHQFILLLFFSFSSNHHQSTSILICITFIYT